MCLVQKVDQKRVVYAWYHAGEIEIKLNPAVVGCVFLFQKGLYSLLQLPRIVISLSETSSRRERGGGGGREGGGGMGTPGGQLIGRGVEQVMVLVLAMTSTTSAVPSSLSSPEEALGPEDVAIFTASCKYKSTKHRLDKMKVIQ